MAEKLAFPKMFRGVDGRQKLGYFDAEGQPIADLTGYRVVTGGGTDYYDPTPDGTDTDEDEQDLNPDPNVRAAQAEYSKGSGGQKERQAGAGYAYATSQAAKSYSNANRGYINKPSWAKYASFLPGPAGMIGKAVNTGININNTAAVNSARKAMGLPSTGVGGAIKGALKDNQGQIARVNIGDGQYSVGFETLDKYGRTNMTPEEAMARARALGVDINEIDFSTGAKKPGGLITKAKEALFGVPQQTVEEQETQKLATPVTEDDENIGGVTVMSDEDVANAQWADVPESSKVRSMPGTVNVTDLERKMEDFNEVENIKRDNIANFPPGQVTPARTTVVGRPEVPGSLPAARMGTTVVGRPETVGSLPAARPGTVVAGRPEVPGSLPAARESVPDVSNLGIARNAYDTSYGVNRGAINAGITALDGFANRNTISAEQAALPGISRNAFDTQKSQTPSRTTKLSVNPITGMQMAPSSAPDPSRFGDATLSPDLDPSQHQSVYSGAQPTSTSKSMLAGSVTTNSPPGRFDKVDLSTASPAQMASLGLVNRTEAERQAMARTIAGELGPKSLKALAANDPNAISEVANMVASMENRIAAERYGTVANALAPSQYNSLMSENLGVTNQNYGLYGDAINKTVADFYAGAVKPTDFGITNYYNASIVDPSWGTKMQNPTEVGQHVFGGLPGDYMPGDTFSAMRDSYAKAQIGDTRGFAPSTAQLARSSPNSTSYTPGIGKGATSSPGNSVSGASRSTAGKTFGSGGSRADSGIGRNDSAGAGRGSSIGGPSIGGSSSSSGGGNYGGSSGSGKSASGGVSGASRSTAGKGGASPSAGSGGQSGAAQSGTSGKTGGYSSGNTSGTTSGYGAGIGRA